MLIRALFEMSIAGTRNLGILLLGLALFGCGASERTEIGPWHTARWSDTQLGGGDQVERLMRRSAPASGVFWQTPLVVGTAVHADPTIRGQHLLRIAIRSYTAADCSNGAPAARPAKSGNNKTVMNGVPDAVVTALGTPELSTEIALISTRHAEHNELAPLPEFAPDWLMVPLRHAGVGRTVLFPAARGCTGTTTKVALPARSFAPACVMLDPKQPFTATVIEVCPVRVSIRTRRKMSIGRLFYLGSKYFVSEWTALRFEADCEDGPLSQETEWTPDRTARYTADAPEARKDHPNSIFAPPRQY